MDSMGTTSEASSSTEYSVNSSSAKLVQALVRDADMLRVGVRRMENGCTIVDCGIDVRGGVEAGRRVAEICLAGLGRVVLGPNPDSPWPFAATVHTSAPVLACLGSQYAGWSLSYGEGRDAFHALGSGPARALAVKEPLFGELGYRDSADSGCLVLEVDSYPPAPLVDKIARDCGLVPEALMLILTPTRSLAGGMQVVSRVLEVALHKAHELGFSLADIVDGIGSAPLPPPSSDFVEAMGRTNDAILFGGSVHLYVHGDDAAVQRLAESLPSSASRDYGRPFAEVFAAYEYDFFKIDPMLFSPAQVTVTALDSGRTFQAGRIDAELLERSFGINPR